MLKPLPPLGPAKCYLAEREKVRIGREGVANSLLAAIALSLQELYDVRRCSQPTPFSFSFRYVIVRGVEVQIKRSRVFCFSLRTVPLPPPFSICASWLDFAHKA